jgi:hypothetical protein
MPNANNNARRKRRQKIHRTQSAIQLAINFPIIENIRAGNVEHGFLPTGAINRKKGEKKQQKPEWPEVWSQKQERRG